MRNISEPRAGYFKTRLVKNGPWVAARIWWQCQCTIGGSVPHESAPECDRPGCLMAEVNSIEADPYKVWVNTEISKAEFDYYLATKKWAEDHAPFMPEANPKQAVDIAQLPVPTF